MFKKLLFAGGVGATLLAAVCGREAFSYAATSLGWARRLVHDQIPTSFELDRARQMIEQLEPEIRHSRRIVAKEEIELERLQGRIDQLVARQAAERSQLERLTADLQTGDVRFVYAGREFSADQVQKDLTHRFARYKTNDGTLSSLRQVVGTRQVALDAAQQKVEEMLALKQQLLAEVSQLEARQKMLEITANSSELAVDDSQLARTRDLLDDIRAKIEVNERTVEVEAELAEMIPLEEPAAGELVAEIETYLQGGTSHSSPVQLVDTSSAEH